VPVNGQVAIVALAAAGAAALVVPPQARPRRRVIPGHRAPVRARLGRVAVDAGLAVDPGPAVQRWAAAALAIPVLWVTFGRVAATLAAVGWVVAPPVAARVRAAGRPGRRDAQLPEALERVASALRGGSSLTTALQATAARTPAPLGDELAAIVASAEGGNGLAVALDRWAEMADTSPARLAAVALALGAETGGAVARAVDGVAATLRDRRNVAAEAGALATQARASAALIALSPLGFAGLVVAVDPAAAAMLLGSPLGVLCLLAGLGLEAAGAAWMSRIVRSTR
jgi:tight adherence protein B